MLLRPNSPPSVSSSSAITMVSPQQHQLCQAFADRLVSSRRPLLRTPQAPRRKTGISMTNVKRACLQIPERSSRTHQFDPGLPWVNTILRKNDLPVSCCPKLVTECAPRKNEALPLGSPGCTKAYPRTTVFLKKTGLTAAAFSTGCNPVVRRRRKRGCARLRWAQGAAPLN